MKGLFGPRVERPAVTTGLDIINAVKKLQDDLAEKESELREVKDGMERGKEEAVRTAMETTKISESALQNELTNVRSQLTASTQRIKQFEETAESTLKQRSDKMKAALNKKLQEAKAIQEANLRKSLTVDEGLELMNGLWLSKEQASEFVQKHSGITALVEEQVDAKVKFRLSDEHPDDQLRDFLATNLEVGRELSTNVKRRVVAEVEKLKAEYEEKIQAAGKGAESAKAKAVLLVKKTCELKMEMAEKESENVKKKVADLGNSGSEHSENARQGVVGEDSFQPSSSVQSSTFRRYQSLSTFSFLAGYPDPNTTSRSST
jgi:nucleoprotein TPR